MPLPKKQPNNKKARKLEARRQERIANIRETAKKFDRIPYDITIPVGPSKSSSKSTHDSRHLYGGSILKGDEIPSITGMDVFACDRWKELLPPEEALTKEDRNWNDPFHHAVASLFHGGGSLKQYGIVPKDPNNLGKIMAYLRAVLPDWGPSHEHKIGGCAHMLRKWCNHV